jgi:hypothetical protein
MLKVYRVYWVYDFIDADVLFLFPVCVQGGLWLESLANVNLVFLIDAIDAGIPHALYRQHL